MDIRESQETRKDELNFTEKDFITESPTFLNKKELRMVIFGGKGGTGKTTSSVATAMYLAHHFPDKKILVASSDPAHSLADSFNCAVNNSITPVKGMDNLWAIEMDSATLLNKFKKKYKFAIDNLSKMSFSTDQIDIRDFLSFKLPGMEEMMILLEFVNFLKFGIFRDYVYDLVIWDTAPTGHTLRLLALPEKVLKWIKLFDRVLTRYKGVSIGVAALGFHIPGHTYPKGNVPKFIGELRKNSEKILRVLKNSEECEFVPVTIPEELSIAETERLIDILKKENIFVRNIIINRLQKEKECIFCFNRRGEQKKYLAEINKKFSSYNLVLVPVFPGEVRGDKNLLNFGRILNGEQIYSYSNFSINIEEKGNSFLPGTMSEMLDKDFQFIIFGGKGGVGKTTVSAASAVALAINNPDKKILVFSTDPAHSLSDSYALPIGDKVTPVPKTDNLFALEVDGARLYQDFRKAYKINIEDAFKKWQEKQSSDVRKWKVDFDYKVMAGFVDTYPPGLEEVLAMEEIMGFVEKKEYDIYVFDTAPTGHLVQLLKFPELVREWLRVTYKAILKYQREYPVDNLEIVSQKILKSQATIRYMRGILTDPSKTEFVAVTIAEAMGMLETEDLLSDIMNLGITCGHLIINMIIPPTRCSFCSAKRKEQTGYIKEVDHNSKYKEHIITKIPLFPHEIRGIENLTELSRFMYEQDGHAMLET